MGDGGVSWSVDEGFAPVEEQTFSFDDGESRSEILLAATKGTIVGVPNVLTDSLIFSIMGWRTRANPRGPSGSPS